MASLNPKIGILGKRLAAHLLRRTTYNVSKARINEYAEMEAREAVDKLLRHPLILTEPRDIETGKPWLYTYKDKYYDSLNRGSVLLWWMQEAIKDETISHRMGFFMHTIFTTSWTFNYSRNVYDHHDLLRRYAFRSFKEMAKRVTVDNLMLRYLDNHYNTKYNPNENYAREFLELFTIGKGPEGNADFFTENDVKEAARLLTGFQGTSKTATDRLTSIDMETGIPRGFARLNRHDIEDKQFSEAFQNTIITGATDADDMFRELDDFVDMVFNQDEVSRNICRKIYRFFVSRNITQEIEQDIIEPLAEEMCENDYSLEVVLRRLLESKHFYDEDDADSSNEIIGTLVKSPIELIFQMINHFNVEIPDASTESDFYYKFLYHGVFKDMFFDSDFYLFSPPTVAGYPGYYLAPARDRNWFSSNSIVGRYSIPFQLIKGRLKSRQDPDIGITKLDVLEYVNNPEYINNPANAYSLVSELAEYIYCEMPDQDRLDYFVHDILLQGIAIEDWTYEWTLYATTGDDSEVRIGLENLLVAMLHSPEYQLM